MKKILAVSVFFGCAGLAWAQGVPAPSPAPTAGPATAAPTISGESKPQEPERDNSHERMRTGRGVRDPGAKAPMNIRLHDGGVKLPKCVEESREGTECK